MNIEWENSSIEWEVFNYQYCFIKNDKYIIILLQNKSAADILLAIKCDGLFLEGIYIRSEET